LLNDGVSTDEITFGQLRRGYYHKSWIWKAFRGGRFILKGSIQ